MLLGDPRNHAVFLHQPSFERLDLAVLGERSAMLIERSVGGLDCDCGCWKPSDADPVEYCRE
ncbi:MAG: hypothetical protein EXR71_19885 [Myxococcales bacterium]|nr:hypothetical protein [Myxococcales bacterium]